MLIKQLGLCNLFYAIPDGPGGSGTTDLDSKDLNKDSIYDALGDDNDIIDLDDKDEKKEKSSKADEKEDVKPEDEDDADKTKDKEDEEEDELADLEEELDGPDEEKLELTTPVRRKEILTKYPNLFKDFPYLEKAYYREQQFTEIYPTIDDARAASEKGQTLDKFENQLMKGSTDEILKAVKDEDQNAFHKIVDNYMVALYNADQNAYYHVLGNINKVTIQHMVTEGKKLQNEALIGAAVILQQFIFGTGEWAPPSKLAKEGNNPDRDAIDTERQQFMNQRFEVARDDLKSRLTNSIKSTIEQNIDKQESMTPYVRKAASEDAMRTLERLINADSRFQSLQNRLWEKAAQENYSKTAMDRIRSAFATKAKTLLPTVLKKARNEALRGLGKRIKNDTEDRNDGSTRAQRDRKTTSSSSSGRGDSFREKASKIPKGMSSLDYLNSD